MRPLRFAIALLVLSAPVGAQTLALTHVNVVDVRTGAIAKDQTILIDSGRIKSVGPAVAMRVPRGARTADYRDAYVVPGLWDMHAHLRTTGRSSFALYLANGVTGVRDMGGNLRITRAWRDSIALKQILAPRLIVAGPIVERAGWLRAVKGMAQKTGDSALVREMDERIPIADTISAAQAVDSVVGLRADFLKIRNDPAPAATYALLRRARERNIPVAGHWPANIPPDAASDSGYHSLEHGPLTAKNGTLLPTLDLMSADERRALYARFVRNGTAYTPTMVSLVGFRLMPDSAIARVLTDTLGATEPRMRYVTAELLKAWRTDFELRKQETGAPLDWAAFNRSWNRDLRDMADAGVLLLAGTDAGSPLVFTGFALADELALMVRDGGLTPLQALQSATINVARWMKVTDFGLVAPGQRADLLILGGDPLADVTNVKRVRAVVRDGRLLDRAALDRLLALARL